MVLSGIKLTTVSCKEIDLENCGYYWIQVHGNPEKEIALYLEDDDEFLCGGLYEPVPRNIVDILSEIILKEN